MIKALALLLLFACKGAPDAVTVFGGYGTSYYDTPSGARAYESGTYGGGLALTYYITSEHTRLEDDQRADTLEAVRRMAAELREIREEAATHQPQMPTIVQLPVPVAEHAPEKPAESEWDIKIKGAITIAIVAVAGLIATTMRKIAKNRKSIKTLEDKDARRATGKPPPS